MPTITSIKLQRIKKRVNIYLDGRFGFGLDLENFVRLGLKAGNVLSDEDVVRILKKGEYQKALDWLLLFVSLRPRSEKEVNDWMARKKVADDLKSTLVEKLKHLDLLDDEKFARWWIEQRLAFKNKSIKDLYYELAGKGIGKEIINKVLNSAEIDEEKSARILLDKKGYRWRGLGKLERRKRISKFLARKGFKWDVIKKVI